MSYLLSGTIYLPVNLPRVGKPRDTIQIKLYFWTNNLPEGQIKKEHPSWVVKKTAWNSGVISLMADEGRGIKPNQAVFSGPGDFLKKLNKLLDDNSINLITTEKIARTGLRPTE